MDVAFIRKMGFDRIIEENDINNASIFFGNFSEKDWKTLTDILRSDWDEKYEEVKAFMVAEAEAEAE